jgi:hypothetical protein
MLTINTHVVLSGHQKEVIRDQLEAVYKYGERDGKILAMEKMIEKFTSNKLEGVLVPVANIVPEGTTL